jgi:acyl carrier protein
MDWSRQVTNDEVLRSRIERILRDDLGIPESVRFDFAEPLETYHMESLAAVNIVFDIENEFGIVFPLETIVQSSFATGNSLLKTVEQLVRSSA